MTGTSIRVAVAMVVYSVVGMVNCFCADSTANTEIMKWKDGKKAVFFLAFDDSCQSHVRTAIPELKKRGLSGTFYINPGNGPFKGFQKAWETELPGPGIEYGNHTFTHSGAMTVADFDRELEKSNDEINKCYPDRKQPRLIAYGKPGGIPKEKWGVTDEEMKQSLVRHNLVERPSFFGPPIHLKTTAEILKVVDTAIAKGEMGHLDFHGVGGDWLVTPLDSYIALLDKLVACKDQVWVTDLVSWHKYMTERKGAEVKVLQADKQQVRLQLACKSDPALYDMPLTLSTKVPVEWKECRVVQGAKSVSAPVVDGAVRYDAMPGAVEILIKPMPAMK